MIKLFMIWTTYICLNGEVADKSNPNHKFFSTNVYSSELYTNLVDTYKAKNRWYKYNTENRLNDDRCIAFMIQHEEVSGRKLLIDVLGLY